jgi:hypothetical protein
MLPEEIQELFKILNSKLDDVTKTAQLVALANKAAPPAGWTRTIMELRRAGFLQGLRTQARNALSNSGEAGMRWVDDPAGWMADRVVARYTGQHTRALLTPFERAAASKRGAKLGFGFMADIMTGKRVLGPGELRKVDWNPANFRRSRIADGWIKWTFRAQGAVDQPWRQAAFMESIYEQAKLLGKTAEEVEVSIKSMIENAPDDLALRAMVDAEEAVFQNESWFGTMIQTAKARSRQAMAKGGVRGGIAGIGNYALEWIVPFSNTPGAVISRVIERTPVGMLLSVRGMARLAKEAAGMDPKLVFEMQRQLTKGFGRATTGTLALGLGAMLAYKGVMSGRWPENSAESRRWIQAGKTEDSILIGGKWMKLTGISPMGNLLAVGAQLVLDAKNPDYEITDKFAIRPVLTALRTVKEQSFLRGTAEFLEVLDSDRNHRWFPNQVGSMIPVPVKDFANVLDPRIRDVVTSWDAVQSSVPFWSFQVPARLDELGRPKIRVQNRWVRLIDPFNSQGIRDDALIQELDRIGAHVPRVSKLRGETQEAYRARSRRIGAERQKALQQTFRMSAFRSLTREQQQEVVSDVLRDARRQSGIRPLASYRRFIGRAIANARRPRRR